MDQLPLSFGKKVEEPKKKQQEAAKERILKSKREEQPKASTSTSEAPQVEAGSATAEPQRDHIEGAEGQQDENDDEGEEEAEDGQEGLLDLPASHEVLLQDHSKTVSALSADPAGARLITGGYDYECKLWDFGGMDTSFKPFRSWEPVPEGSYQVNDTHFSITGDRVLVASATPQVKLFTRDAQPLATYAKGDMYLRDLKNTSGHIAEVTSCAWHPTQRNTFLTASHDSTLRLWDTERMDKSKSVIVVKSKARGQRTQVTSSAWTNDGKYIAAAGSDGALYVWGTNSNFVRPNYSTEKICEPGSQISGMSFSLDNHTLTTRGTDNTVKLWDMRALKKPLAVNSDLPNFNAETNVIFSPDENYILTGTAGKAVTVNSKLVEIEERAAATGNGSGQLAVLRRSDLEPVTKLSVSQGSIIKTLWHPRINQLFLSTSTGGVHVMYNPDTSVKGATLALGRLGKPRSTAADETTLPGTILTPHALPMFQDDPRLTGKTGKRRREKERQDPVKTMKPLPPISGPGRGGRVGASATQHMVQGLNFNNTRDEDPREALLKYAAKEDGGESLFTGAWKKTQPKAIYDENPEEEEHDTSTGELKQRKTGPSKDKLQPFKR